MTIDQHARAKRLRKTIDPEIEKAIHRRPTFDGKIIPFDEIDERIAGFIRNARKRSSISRADLASMLGLSTQVYGRYERAFSKMHVTRMVHLAEILDFMPIELVYTAAPHLWGEDAQEAEDRFKLARLVIALPPQTTRTLIQLVEELTEFRTDGKAEGVVQTSDAK